MYLDVSRALKNPGDVFSFSQAIPVEPQDILGDEVLFEDVAIRGEYTGAGESVRLTGRVAGVAKLPCARCVKRFDLPLEFPLNEVFVKESDELNPDHRQLSGSVIDIGQLMLESLVLALPIRFLCDEDCKGLCHVCGADLSKGQCGCVEDQDASGALRALSKLLSDND